MSLDVIETKLSASQYSTPVAFVRDVLLTFNNAILYNDKDTKIAQAAADLVELVHTECGKYASLREACELAASAESDPHSDAAAAVSRIEASSGQTQAGDGADDTQVARAQVRGVDASLATETREFKELEAALSEMVQGPARTSMNKVTKAALAKVESHSSGKVATILMRLFCMILRLSALLSRL